MHATIDDRADIHTLLNTFTVPPERQQALVDCLRIFTEDHARKQPGFVGASVHASLDQRSVVNYVQWKTKAHLDAFFKTPPAKAHLAEIGTLARTINPVEYHVAYVGTNKGS